jgi:hypothetical protein
LADEPRQRYRVAPRSVQRGAERRGRRSHPNATFALHEHARSIDPQAVADLVTLSARRLRISCETYHAMADALLPLRKTELIDGHIIATSPTRAPHLSTAHRVTQMLQRLLSAGKAEPFLLPIQSPLRLDDGTEPEPDVPCSALTSTKPAFLRPPTRRS